MNTILYQLAMGIAQGALEGFAAAWAKYGPQIVTSTVQAARNAWTTTVTQAPTVPQNIKDAANQELNNAMDTVDRNAAVK